MYSGIERNDNEDDQYIQEDARLQQECREEEAYDHWKYSDDSERFKD